MKVLVCGGRDYNDVDTLFRILDEYIINGKTMIKTIISGHAKGADQMAEMYAQEMGIKTEVYPANWNRYGKKAGYLRNVQMAEEGKPDLIIAFPGGKGTAMMIKIGKERGINVMEIGEEI